MEMSVNPPGPPFPEIDEEMPVELLRDFDTILLFGRLRAIGAKGMTVQRVSREECFPPAKAGSVLLVRCYDTRTDPVLFRGRVARVSGSLFVVEELELIPYKTQRGDSRCPLCPPAPASILDNGAPEGSRPCRLLNISAGGACIETEHRCPVGQEVFLRVRLIKTEPCLSFPCRVTRATPRRGGRYEYGLLFAALDEKQRGCLENALQDRVRLCFGFSEEERQAAKKESCIESIISP